MTPRQDSLVNRRPQSRSKQGGSGSDVIRTSRDSGVTISACWTSGGQTGSSAIAGAMKLGGLGQKSGSPSLVEH
jgi:hypothetical protein